jgi:ribosomal protein S18 acetylase RimI-like enzyme
MLDHRPATANDIDSIIRFDEIAEQPETGRADFIRRSVTQGVVHVAVLDSQPVAYGVLIYTFFGNAFIDLLYVNPNQRRRGIGVSLMVYLESISEGEKLFTSTNLSNLRMQALLQKLGYTLSGVIHNLDEGDPELVYFKRLR